MPKPYRTIRANGGIRELVKGVEKNAGKDNDVTGEGPNSLEEKVHSFLLVPIEIEFKRL